MFSGEERDASQRASAKQQRRRGPAAGHQKFGVRCGLWVGRWDVRVGLFDDGVDSELGCFVDVNFAVEALAEAVFFDR